MKPANEMASTSYCLAATGKEYLVYLPEGGTVTVDLSAASGGLTVEWFDPANNKTSIAARVTGGARRELSAPAGGPAVLHLTAAR